MITHKGTKTIKTLRLVLRRFTYGDAGHMFDTWANDERGTKILAWTPHKEVSLTKQLICHRCWIEHMDLGYCIGYDFWNKGLVTEAVNAVIDYLFNEIGVNRISIWHAVKNPASGKVAKKCGMTFEGVYRQYYKSSDGEYLDIAVWSILKYEYKLNRKL